MRANSPPNYDKSQLRNLTPASPLQQTRSHTHTHTDTDAGMVYTNLFHGQASHKNRETQ